MPSPPKDRPSGRFGRLLAALRPSRGGSLPVQTGFPTSLADLVVKNHDRLKKQPSPSSKRGGKRSATPSSPSPPPPSPPPTATAVVSSPSDRPRTDLSPPGRRSEAFGLGLGFLALGGVVSLAILVIWSRKVVAAVTVASFSLFLLEFLRSRRPRPPPATGVPPLYLVGRGRVSPIREVEPETEPSLPTSRSESFRESDASSVLSTEETSGVLDESGNPKAKAKRRSWKKLVAAGAKKLQQKGRRRGEAADSPGSFRGEGSGVSDFSDSSRRGDAVAEDAVAEEPEPLGSRRRGGAVEIDAAGAMGIDAPRDRAEEAAAEEYKAGSRFPALVPVAVVLVGLVAGKLPAVAVTMLCFVFVRSVGRSPPGGGLQRRRL